MRYGMMDPVQSDAAKRYCPERERLELLKFTFRG